MILGVLVFLVLVAVWIARIYNKLVTTRNAARHAFAQIEAQLAHRHDLVTDLAEATKAHLQHDRGTLEAVIEARNTAAIGLKSAAADPANAVAVGQLSTAENQLSSALGRVFALAGADADIKTNTKLTQLSDELATTESRIAMARQAYNDAVTIYNNAREIFPNNFVAGNFSFAAMQLLEIESSANR